MYACRNGHIEIVKLLLQDERVDPSANENTPVRYAYMNNYPDVIKLLKAHPRYHE